MHLEINKNSWNERATVHYDSKFYDVKSFIKGRTSLNEIELSILGDLKGKKILHLQKLDKIYLQIYLLIHIF